MSNDRLDAVKGCLIGGAAGDALGYAVEFIGEKSIFRKYGENGICSYEYDRETGLAIISDDTQMTLFTAAAIADWYDSHGKADLNDCMRSAYVAWYHTQVMSPAQYKKVCSTEGVTGWLCTYPQLFRLRAPGNTCLCALAGWSNDKAPKNDSKGCGTVMRVAPLGCVSGVPVTAAYDASYLTHMHPLGCIPSVILAETVRGCVYNADKLPLRDIVEAAMQTAVQIYGNDMCFSFMRMLLTEALELSENDKTDLENIHILGEGWAADEALAIAVYCALRHSDDFSACIIAAVNHKGDSDSTGAIAGNILGAYLGYEAIDEKWKQKLELSDVIIRTAEILCGQS